MFFGFYFYKTTKFSQILFQPTRVGLKMRNKQICSDLKLKGKRDNHYLSSSARHPHIQPCKWERNNGLTCLSIKSHLQLKQLIETMVRGLLLSLLWCWNPTTEIFISKSCLELNVQEGLPFQSAYSSVKITPMTSVKHRLKAVIARKYYCYYSYLILSGCKIECVHVIWHKPS